MNAVLLFAGQGAQKVGMGKDLAESYTAVRALFDQADATLGYSLSSIMYEGPMEELTKTSRCQPALYAHGLAILEVLKSKVPALNITATAGLSLGEFTAHAAAGTFDFATGLNLVFQRGSFMEEACENTKGAMLALLGGEESAIRELAQECDVDVANLNAPGQIVLSGSAEGIADAAAKAKDKGIKRAIPLPVAGAYHSRLMKSAQDKLAVALAAAPIQSPKVPVVCNFEARPVSTPEEIRSTLTSQVTGSVRWVESMQHLIAAGHTTFIELGPDATLAGLMGKIDKSVKVISIKDAASLDAAVAALTAG
ncbi:ACP S-malonyltransferase [Prosthecobacter vanneervenii]|uniref:Malonyl CoA-acyl carrier protein transacylase n=1 Tax=Prosthecobacter vanneervenii TaxID=48466 RepID=A0A7W7Y719_9BACT|nr:ACP S-malonyltransferase [Prosthecobacter vanneervenii]MBB5030778.1 [acyl-carrier-protein] S-malonyltransferase [Prosthecobacter vanneervenii]